MYSMYQNALAILVGGAPLTSIYTFKQLKTKYNEKYHHRQ